MSVGPDGVLLVDTGFKETAEELNTLIRKLGKGEVEYIINTHLHGDHVSGNWICGKNATLVDFENLEECMSYGFVFPGNGDLEGKLAEAFGPYYSLNFNGDKIQIIPCPNIHSNADLLVYFSKSGVVHMGDLLLTQSFPAVGSKVKEYMAFLDKIVAIFPPGTKFIAGHGRDYTMDDLKDYRQMLKTTIAIVHKDMKAGKSLAQIQGAKVLKKWESWGEFLTFLNCDTWIEFIFTSYPELFRKNANSLTITNIS
jgi:glyoxylase-like metal-dependent hydrolase (beta-lactamase superfamily II)